MVNYVFTLENFEYFLLILVRVTCFVYVAPLLGQQGIPNQIKIGFSFFVSLLLYNVVEAGADIRKCCRVCGSCDQRGNYGTADWVCGKHL